MAETKESLSDRVEGRLLDGFLLLAAGGSSSPEDVVRVNLSSLQIVDVAAEDLEYFTSLDSLDVSDNHLGYEQVCEHFSRLPQLTRLLLPCNSITALQVPMGALPQLRSLDLSFNELHGEVLAQLARLPRLQVLNLSSNCISSVPPEEELYTLTALEELNLDANDLVQFDQWRALDALPNLRRLSLASNRVKRLKDDSVSNPAGMSYFPALEVLNLSANEIADLDSLPVLKYFCALTEVYLTENPCCSGAKPTPTRIAGRIKVRAETTKPFYLKGSGCHQRPTAVKEPRLKLDRKRLKKVRAFPPPAKLQPAGRRLSQEPKRQQLGFLDDSGTRLVVDLPPSGRAARSRTPPGAGEAGDSGGGGFFVTEAMDGGEPMAPGDGYDDDLDDEEQLEEVFRANRARIEARFNAPVEEPASFMRAVPFEVTAAVGEQLGFRKSDASEEDGRDPGSTILEDSPAPEQTQLMAAAAERRARWSVKESSLAEAARSPSPAHMPEEAPSESPERVVLPPIVQKDAGASQRAMPNLDVKEAFKALRAAMMSDLA